MAEYQGKKVELNKPIRGGSKKFYVYVKNDKGNVVKVSFGDPNTDIKRDDPDRRSNFRARHNCDDPGPKWKARYWSCKMWGKKNVSDLTEEDRMKGEDPCWDDYEMVGKKMKDGKEVPNCVPKNEAAGKHTRRGRRERNKARTKAKANRLSPKKMGSKPVSRLKKEAQGDWTTFGDLPIGAKFRFTEEDADMYTKVSDTHFRNRNGKSYREEPTVDVIQQEGRLAESDTRGWDPELLKIARKFDRDEVNLGIKIEKEHDEDPATDVVKDKNDLLKIALAHLEEDPEYYTHLVDMESKFEDTDEAYSPSEYPQSRDPYNDDSTIPGTHQSQTGAMPRGFRNRKRGKVDHKPLGRERPRLKEQFFGRNHERVMRSAGLLNESMSRWCMFYKAKNGDWYMELAPNEYGDQRDATTYGPFSSMDEADEYLSRNFSNPGSMHVDSSGTKPVPKKSPSGRPVQSPNRRGYY